MLKHRIKIYYAIAGLLALLTVFGLAADRPSNKDCLDCHGDKTLTKTNAAGKEIALFTDKAILAASMHKTNFCVDCHADLTDKHPDDNVAAKPVSCATCHERQTESYGASVHGLALKAGKSESATCADCHGTHNILSPASEQSPLHWSKLDQTCGECHTEAAKDVQASVHGRGTAKGEREAATCTDCHSEHKIEKLRGESALKVAGDVCAKCHASERVNSKYSLPKDRVKTFFESYHGLAVQSGMTRAANCSSCHGVHKILPSSDTNSSIHASHLIETCGKCHIGASENFVSSKIHVDDTVSNGIGALVNRWVRHIYMVLIIGTVAALGSHNLLIWLRKVLAMRRCSSRTVERMDPQQRLQHMVLLTSFIILAISGFALKWPDSWLAWLFANDEDVRRWVHRVAGIVLLGIGVWHVIYALTNTAGRQLVRDLWPRWKDALDVFANLRHLILSKGKPAQIGRFGYAEKIEYWAVIWGTIIMGITGLMIWFKMDVTTWLPRWAVEVATTIHYYEAILACLAIIVWHFYHVMFDPDIYPMNWAWWDGKVSKDWYQHEHPLDPAINGTPAAQETAKTEKSVPSAKSEGPPGDGKIPPSPA